MDVDDDEEEQKTNKQTPTKKTKQSQHYKEGMLLKKKKKSLFKTWEPRFLVLDQDKLLFYTDKTKKTLKKTLDLKTQV